MSYYPEPPSRCSTTTLPVRDLGGIRSIKIRDSRMPGQWRWHAFYFPRSGKVAGINRGHYRNVLSWWFYDGFIMHGTGLAKHGTTYAMVVDIPHAENPRSIMANTGLILTHGEMPTVIYGILSRRYREPAWLFAPKPEFHFPAAKALRATIYSTIIPQSPKITPCTLPPLSLSHSAAYPVQCHKRCEEPVDP